MKELFPAKQVMGFVASLVLTLIALLVVFTDMSYTAGMTILLVTAFIQATLQLVVFMHAGETEDGWAIYSNILFGIVIVVLSVLGTLLILLWDM
ncbi:cytochrome aa3 quinol oxidase subunit IV [Lysinibacillus yapensis]|uniref:Quinol oxidase subunit 4 n=1 Tax=Ureibacillus yapensis TaxID=2304605 RepID=A0A396SQ73_9BACL|nr:cytochrome aa3 quinol oxidase subunit IV [Lysinibacillus yapensis]RHW38299.1 cytochrome aa3 quinol oxidase subunit IV [Lysinibacillus yapensis]